MLLSIKRCPHTGVLNVYSAVDPFLAIGSISRRPHDGFTWHCHAGGTELSGRAPDMATAERRLTGFLNAMDDATETRHAGSHRYAT